MRIDQSNVLRMYESTQKSTKPEASAQGPVRDITSAKTDRVSISAKAVQNGSVMRTVQKDAAEIEGAVNAERLAQLAGQINAGTYNVPADKIAGAILNALG